MLERFGHTDWESAHDAAAVEEARTIYAAVAAEGAQRSAALTTRDAAAEIAALRVEKDAEMLRVKACEHIAEGDEGWEALQNECPSTAAVAALRRERDALFNQVERLRVPPKGEGGSGVVTPAPGSWPWALEMWNKGNNIFRGQYQVRMRWLLDAQEATDYTAHPSGYEDDKPEQIPRCAERWETMPYSSDHVWRGDHHGIAFGDCIKCGLPVSNWNARLTTKARESWQLAPDKESDRE